MVRPFRFIELCLACTVCERIAIALAPRVVGRKGGSLVAHDSRLFAVHDDEQKATTRVMEGGKGRKVRNDAACLRVFVLERETGRCNC